MFLDLIDVCNKYDLRLELIPDHFDMCIMRMTSKDGIRMNQTIGAYELEIIREDPDRYIMKYIIPQMIDAIEKYRKEHQCV